MRFTIPLSILCAYSSLWTIEAFKGHLPSVKKDLCFTSTSLSERSRGSFVPDLPNPFAGIKVPSFYTSTQIDDEPFEPSPEGLVRQAKRVLASDLGLLYPSLLDEEFEWIGPTVDRPLGKTDYLAAGRFFDLRSTFPDLNYRAHDFRIDKDDDATVRLTCRTVGTMRGELRLRDTILSPTGNIMRCPPEAVSMTFDKQTGKLVKLCTGFSLDRLAGNTRGTTGVMAASLTAGKPVSEWEIYPPLTILKRFFARPDEPIPEATNFLAPFPETVMIQLAKGVVSSNMAVEDPSLLSNDFTYCTPSIGPIGKKKFIKQFAAEEFDGVNPNFSNFRVDPYGPNRVWVDLKPTGPGYEGAPQAMSFTFDENGFCTRVTSRAVMDPTIGNGGGLGGPEGLKFALGVGSNEFASRPLPRILGRLKVKLLNSLPGSQLKEKRLPSMRPLAPRAKPVAPPQPLAPAERIASKAPPPLKPSTEREKLPTPLRKLSSFGTVNLLKMREEAASRKESEAKAKREKSPPPLQKLSESLGTINLLNMREEAAARKESEAKAKRQKFLPSLQKLSESLGTINLLDMQKKAATSLPVNGSASQSVTARAKAAKVQQSAQKRREAEVSARKAEVSARKAEAEKKRREAEDARAKALQERQLAARKAEEENKRRETETAQAKALQERQLAARKAEEEKKRRNAEERRATEAKALQDRQLAAKKVEEENKRREAAKRKAAQAKALQEREVAKKKAAQAKALQDQAAKKAEAERALREAEKRRKAEATKKQRKVETRAAMQKTAVEEKKRLAQQKQKEQKALNALAKAPLRATIQLLGLGGSDDEDEGKTTTIPTPASRPATTKTAPRGVPTISRWRKNLDGSVSGLVSGSRSFGDGERITTSRIAKGTIASGEVVTTGSGSRYFLQ